ncbi:MAG: diphthamide synthesis protein [Thermoplasmatales archaeon]|nr:diphthamide synthesis protein [Thermoplasmatales archaeon]
MRISKPPSSESCARRPDWNDPARSPLSTGRCPSTRRTEKGPGGSPHYTDNREAVQRLVERLQPRLGSDARAAPHVYARVGPELFEALRQRRPKRIALQVPAGLVRNAHELAEQIRAATGAPVFLAGRPCFGACDVPMPDEVPGAEVAVVLGHAPIPNMVLPLPTYFVEMRYSGGDPSRLAEMVKTARLPARLGIVASVQHLDIVAPLERELVRVGFSPRVGAGDRRLAYPAQALGCNYTGAEQVAAEVDAFLFVGTGRFHPIGLALATDRPVYSLDPLQERSTRAISRAERSTPTSTRRARGLRSTTPTSIRGPCSRRRSS